LKLLVGQTLGSSPWIQITQDQINAFADATGDHQWIHCDPDRARRESPFETTISHGFLTLSLLPALADSIFVIEGFSMAINYGLNRVRFPNAVPAESKIRLTTDLIDLKEMRGAVSLTYKQTIEVQGLDKPACVAEALARLFFDD
jgi:acyl dehydratase